jgi:hypothetical protein
MAELLVELSRIIEERIYLEVCTEVKKVMRRRGVVVSDIQGINNLNDINHLIS